MTRLSSEKRKNVLFGLRINPETLRRFKTIAAQDRRNLNDEFEFILEDWLRLTGRQPRQAPEGLEEVGVEPLQGSESKVAESSQEQSGKRKVSGHSHRGK